MSEPVAEPIAHRRRIVGVVIAGFCCFLQLYATQPLLALFRDVFHATEAQVSLTVSAAALAVAITSPFVGLLADSLGRKRIIIPCLLGLTLATFLCAAAPDLPWFIAFRALAGIFVPGVVAVTFAYISEESPRGSAGSVTSLYVTGTVLGALTGRLASAFAADHLPGGWRSAFLLLGVLSLLGAAATWYLLPSARQFQPHPHWHAGLRAMLGHLRNRRLLATYLVGAAALFTQVGLFTYCNFHLSAPPFSLSTSGLGSIFLVSALGLVITPLSGRLIDRFGHRFGAILSTVTIATGVLIALIPSLSLFIIGAAIASSGVSIAQSTASSHVGKAANGSRSAASGLYVSCYYIGGALGATGLVKPWQAAGWPAVILAILLVQALALILAWRCFAHLRQSAQPQVLPLD